MNEEHGIYAGVVDIARNGVDEVIRLRAINEELIDALRDLVWAASHSEYLEYQYADQLGKARAALAKVEASDE